MQEQARATCEVTITVHLDGVTETFTADSMTTGRPTLVTRNLLTSVQDEAVQWARERQSDDTPPDPGVRRRAEVVAVTRSNGCREQVEMDTTTPGDVHAAAIALIRAAKAELWDRLYDLERTTARRP